MSRLGDDEPLICSCCVEEAFLSKEIAAYGREEECSYCDRVEKCFKIKEMAERIEKVFDEHYVRSSDEPSPYQSMLIEKRNYAWEPDGEIIVDVIRNSAEIPEEAAEDIQKLLEEKFFDPDSAKIGEKTEFSSDLYYHEAKIDAAQWRYEWGQLEHSLELESRFFNSSALDLLKQIFENVECLSSEDGRSLIVDVGPGTELTEIFRARAIQTNEELEKVLARPEKGLGPPPPDCARAGRMNARGISVFYGSNSPEVALAEVRPPINCQVAIARFEILRRLRLLDLTAMETVTTSGSIFDPNSKVHFERVAFLQKLSEIITWPIMPNDEASGYLVTQAITDFLAMENEPPLDGILFPSVQRKGTAFNIVLFHKAAQVQNLELPEGIRISVTLFERTYDGSDFSYSVAEVLPFKDETPSEEEPHGLIPLVYPPAGDELYSQTGGLRKDTLRIDLESVNVHIVKSVEIETMNFTVTRDRRNEPDPSCTVL